MRFYIRIPFEMPDSSTFPPSPANAHPFSKSRFSRFQCGYLFFFGRRLFAQIFARLTRATELMYELELLFLSVNHCFLSNNAKISAHHDSQAGFFSLEPRSTRDGNGDILADTEIHFQLKCQQQCLTRVHEVIINDFQSLFCIAHSERQASITIICSHHFCNRLVYDLNVATNELLRDQENHREIKWTTQKTELQQRQRIQCLFCNSLMIGNAGIPVSVLVSSVCRRTRSVIR